MRFARYLRETKLPGGLPISWIAIVVTATIAGIAVSETRDALVSDRDPRPTPLNTIFAADAPANRHVEVEGLLLPETRVISAPDRRGGPKATDFVYEAMIGEPPKILLVRFAGDTGPGFPRRATISGLLRPPEATLARRLDVANWSIQGVAVEKRYVLIPGLSPPLARLSGAVAFVFGSVALLLIVAEIRSRRTVLPTSLIPFEGTSHGEPDAQDRRGPDGSAAG